MGAINSCCIPRHADSHFKEARSSTPKAKGHRRNLSATFNMTLIEEKNPNLINVNYASEEEFMTLPGIDRTTARNIIEYRRTIGGFRKVEEVALVSGVGAAKLNSIRDELTVSISRQASLLDRNSEENSVSGSKSDVSKSDTEKKGRSVINVNTANVFQLMEIKGIGQVLAENIVTYRDKKGAFKSKEDLVKVKGIGPNLLSAISPFVILSDKDLKENTQPNGNVMTGDHNHSNSVNNCKHDGMKMLSTSTENMLEILEPYIKDFKESVRPKVKPFKFKHKNRGVVRIASWNLERFDVEKATNPGVRDVVCMTILENGFGIVAFQELGDQEAISKICTELNKPSLPSVRKWQGHKGSWKFVVSEATGRMYRSNEYNGFLYDTTQGIEPLGSGLLQKSAKAKKPFVRKPYIGTFKIKKLDCVIVSVHLKATGLDNEDLGQLQEEVEKVPNVAQALSEHYPGEEDIILLGDFNLTPDAEDFDCMRDKGYKCGLPTGVFTNISNKNPKGSKTYDHIWLSSSTLQVFSGESGVVRESLTSPLIPNGWSWGGVVSDHCPVWVELYTGKDLDDADLNKSLEDVKFTIANS
ncbi:hypothetical protein FSP39_024371 [Pinctada imbricata]|uniref:Endonuclease/exonuclease/phosphatase family domain-containing protein 1 n=1 Tax=Pinctada imbricata TaxID=66713 RepID=A0AA88XM73_PINIB|nr:hypothetical protein FSP39_024371 [Pinctada imbricata]